MVWLIFAIWVVWFCNYAIYCGEGELAVVVFIRRVLTSILYMVVAFWIVCCVRLKIYWLMTSLVSRVFIFSNVEVGITLRSFFVCITFTFILEVFSLCGAIVCSVRVVCVVVNKVLWSFFGFAFAWAAVSVKCALNLVVVIKLLLSYITVFVGTLVLMCTVVK